MQTTCTRRVKAGAVLTDGFPRAPPPSSSRRLNMHVTTPKEVPVSPDTLLVLKRKTHELLNISYILGAQLSVKALVVGEAVLEIVVSVIVRVTAGVVLGTVVGFVVGVVVCGVVVSGVFNGVVSVFVVGVVRVFISVVINWVVVGP